MKPKKVTQKQIERCFIEKKPKTKHKHVGVEIECFGPLDNFELAKKLTEAGLNKYIQRKDDRSIEADYYDDDGEMLFTHELCILAQQRYIYRIVKQVCNLLQKENFQVNKTCGLHVHLDMRSRSVKNSFKRLVNNQILLEDKVDYARVDGEFCSRNKTTNINDILKYYGKDDPIDDYDLEQDVQNERFLAINPIAYKKYKTLECRLHEGTIEANKIKDWIKLLIRVADGKKVA